MASDPLDSVRDRIRNGDSEGARTELAGLIQAQPQNIDAWGLLANLLDDPQQQADCYRQILRLKPGNLEAAAHLSRIMGKAELDQALAAEGDPNELVCPACGAQMDQRGGRAVCAYCGAETAVPATLEEKSGPEAQNHLPWDMPGAGVIPDPERVLSNEIGQLVALLREQGPGILDEAGIQRLKAQGIEVQVKTDGVTIISGTIKITVDNKEMPSNLQNLSPQQLVGAAGKPLAETERQNCPKCQAVIAASETKCPWCGELLGAEQPLELDDIQVALPITWRHCPNCDAVVEPGVTKCPWCSTALPSTT